MDLSKIALFGAVKKRLAWLTQRQEILAQNIANADTPGYTPKDIEPFTFKQALRREATSVNMTTTNGSHLGGARRHVTEFGEEDTRRPYETAPAGNAVIIEEQMMKVGETTMNHRLTTELYRKHLGMIRMALGRR